MEELSEIRRKIEEQVASAAKNISKEQSRVLTSAYNCITIIEEIFNKVPAGELKDVLSPNRDTITIEPYKISSFSEKITKNIYIEKICKTRDDICDVYINHCYNKPEAKKPYRTEVTINNPEVLPKSDHSLMYAPKYFPILKTFFEKDDEDNEFDYTYRLTGIQCYNPQLLSLPSSISKIVLDKKHLLDTVKGENYNISFYGGKLDRVIPTRMPNTIEKEGIEMTRIGANTLHNPELHKIQRSFS